MNPLQKQLHLKYEKYMYSCEGMCKIWAKDCAHVHSTKPK